jgi:hypothetical protein
VAGFISERWPTSPRNDGRHHLGTLADITSERVAGLRRNLHYIEQLMAASLTSGDVVVLDGLAAQKLDGVRRRRPGT